MNKSLWVGVAIGVAIAAGAGAMAGYALKTASPRATPATASTATDGAGGVNTPAPATQHHWWQRSESQFADVVQVVPLSRQVSTPRQACQDVTVTHTRPARDTHQIIGSVAGALLGGLLGHQIGGGTGKDIATVAGAAAGGYAGNRIEEHVQAGNTYTTTEHQCHTVYDKREEPNGYQVRYRLNGHEGTVHMDHAPGQRIPVRDGQLVLDAGGSN